MSTENKPDSKSEKKRKQWPRVRKIEGRLQPWLVDGRLNGKGERFFFATATEADTKADQLRIDRNNTGKEGASISTKLRADAIDAQRRLAEVGATIGEAVDYYLVNARPTGGKRTVREVIPEFISAKRVAGRKENYLEVQSYVLGVFATEFGDRHIHEVAAPEIDTWMGTKGWSMRTRLNYFSDIRNLFGFAIRKKYRATNPMAALEKPMVDKTSPGVLTVEQAAALLTVAGEGKAEMLPAIALGLFAGVRTAELELLDWRHIDLDERNIHVPPEVAKTREGRDIDMSDNLIAWLRAHTRQAGPVAPPKSFDWRLAQKATAAGIKPWPKNALRHSFASYHLKRHGNAPLTATMLGHQGSTQTLFKRYHKRVKPADAVRFWMLAPSLDASRKVVQIAA
jgi:integrase